MIFNNVKLLFKPTISTTVPLDNITFPLDSTMDTSPFVIESIDGLGPPDINVAISNTLRTGGSFQNRVVQDRQIVMTIGFQPNYSTGQTVESLRTQLYGFIEPKLDLPVTFVLRNGSTDIASTLCYVKRLEVNVFSKDPQVVMTLACVDPFFTAALYAVPSPSTLPTQPMTIINQGSAPTGFTIKFTLTSASSSVRLSNGYGQVWFNYAFLSGDVITINTTVGSLSATSLRSGVTTNLLPYLLTNPRWIPLHPGENKIWINGPATWTLTSILYYPRYWGV